MAVRLDGPGHVEVQDEHVRVPQLDESQRVRDIAGLTDDVQSLFALQQQAQTGADDFVIVGEDDVDRRRGIVGLRHASDDRRVRERPQIRTP